MRPNAGGARFLVLWAVASTMAWLGSAAPAQQAQVYAGSNDTPDPLINASFSGTTMSYGAEIGGGLTTGTATNLAFNQVRVFKSNAPGCSLVAQTHNGGNTVAIFGVTASGGLFAVPGTPVFIGLGGGGQSLAWAPDGGALYVPISIATPPSQEFSGRVVTLAVTCSAGGVINVNNVGAVALRGIDLPRDAEVIGAGIGSHLCVTGTNSNNLGCFPISPATRLPGVVAASTIAVDSARGVRIAPNGCGVAALGSANAVQGFKVDAAGILTATNTAATSTAARYGAIRADGTLAAFGGLGNELTLFSVDSSCNLAAVGSGSNGITGSLVEYMAFDAANRLYVSDSLANQIRVFAPTSAGLGAMLSLSTTNHPRVNPPSGIDAALLSSLPVELIEFGID